MSAPPGISYLLELPHWEEQCICPFIKWGGEYVHSMVICGVSMTGYAGIIPFPYRLLGWPKHLGQWLNAVIRAWPILEMDPRY